MPVRGATLPTLLDVAKRTDPDGNIATVVELLNQTNEITRDVPFFEGNLPTGHRTTMRSGLPTVAWRLINQGVQPSKSTTVQQTDTAGEMLAYSQIDSSLLELNGNDAQWRQSEEQPFIESMGQQFATTLVYGNTAVNPERFLGLAARYSALTAVNGRNVVNAGGSAARTSIWIVVWGANTCHMFYPKGSRAGLEQRDLGEENITQADGSIMPAYRTRYKWKAGLSLRDWRYVVRIANIDSSALATAGEAGYTGPNLINLLARGINQIENLSMGQPIIYCNRTVKTALDLLALNKANVHLTMEEWGGEMVTTFRRIPIRQVDAITNNEAAVA